MANLRAPRPAALLPVLLSAILLAPLPPAAAAHAAATGRAVRSVRTTLEPGAASERMPGGTVPDPTAAGAAGTVRGPGSGPGRTVPDPTVAGRAAPALPGAAVRYGWPLPGRPPVLRAFAPPPRPWLPGHRGVDLGGAEGLPVLAAGPGVVVFAGTVAGVGVVSVEHTGGLRTTYQPVRPEVRAGQLVARGARLGLLRPAHPGCPVPACLHWGLRDAGRYLDPLLLLGLGRVRLLPLVDGGGPGDRGPADPVTPGGRAALP